jgi:hypothetical protein
MASNTARSSVHTAGQRWTSSSQSTPGKSRAASPSMCSLSRMRVDATLPRSAQDPAELSYRPGVASLHRPDPMTIVVTPSLVVELAYVKLPS